MKLERGDLFEEAVLLLGGHGIGLIDDIRLTPVDLPALAAPKPRPDASRKLYVLEFLPSLAAGGGRRYFDFGQLSYGTRRIIGIIVSMLFDRSSVLMIEHPEDGLHAGLARKLIDFLRAYSHPGQLILSSHSSVVLDVLRPGEIRFVGMDFGATTVRALTPDEVALAGVYLEETGTLSGFLEMTHGE
jgi:hypothetical protein